MHQYGYITLCLIIICSTLVSCSTSNKLSSTDSKDGITPLWFQSSGFESDSSNFAGFATAVAADSMLAIARAEDQARAELENHIAQKLEVIRTQLEENGSLNVIDPEFILTLRNSHAAVEKEAKIVQSAAVFVNNYYRGFAKATITKSDLMSMLEGGFEDKMKMWNEFSSSEYFATELQN